jgi:hypothetical protein
MSRFEIELYYRVFAAWLLKSAEEEARPVPIRLIGTYDSCVSPDPRDLIVGLTALVHLNGAQRRRAQSLLPISRISIGR